jgi:hypothetical protein
MSNSLGACAQELVADKLLLCNFVHDDRNADFKHMAMDLNPSVESLFQ